MIFKILFWHSNWVWKCCFDSQNPILTFELSLKIVFWHSKSYFDIRTESENAILIFKILFWHSNWVGKSYFDIRNPILTFELSLKMLFWYSKSILPFELSRKIRNLTFKIPFWHSNSVGKCYYDILNPILTFELIRKIVFWHSKSYFWHSNWVGKSYFVCGGVYCFHLVRPSIRQSVCPSVLDSFFSNILKTQWWIFINFCRHIDINKVHPYKKK